MEYFYRKTITDVVESAFLFFSKWNIATKMGISVNEGE